MPLIRGLYFNNLRGDIYGGLTAAVVALPLARRLAAADEYDALVLDLAEVPFLDSSALLTLEDAITQAQARAKQVYLVGARPEVARTLAQLGVNKRLPDGHHHVSRLEALHHASATIAANGDD